MNTAFRPLWMSVTFAAATVAFGCSGEPTAPGVEGVQSTTIEASSLNGSAVALRVRCERRFNPARSRISVDADNVMSGARFKARVRSGTNAATSPVATSVGDEVEFDFDSEPDDIASGDVAIAPNFIRLSATPDVVGILLDTSGNVVARAGVNCEVRRD